MAAAAALALVQLRGIAESAADLQGELRRLSEVRGAVLELRSASELTRAQARDLRRR
jgi:hypothetical protein